MLTIYYSFIVMPFFGRFSRDPLKRLFFFSCCIFFRPIFRWSFKRLFVFGFVPLPGRFSCDFISVCSCLLLCLVFSRFPCNLLSVYSVLLLCPLFGEFPCDFLKRLFVFAVVPLFGRFPWPYKLLFAFVVAPLLLPIFLLRPQFGRFSNDLLKRLFVFVVVCPSLAVFPVIF